MANPTERRVEKIIADWPSKTPGQQQHPKETAKRMLDKYGVPDEVTPNRLIWHDNGPWKRTVVRRETQKHEFPFPHLDHLAQTIDYQVPLDKYDELAHFDGSTYPDRTKGELTATCHKEAANFLALNLAHDVITGERTVEEAREDYGRINAKLMAGGSPAYTQGFQFPLPEGDQRDPDVTIITDEVKQNVGVVGLAGLLIAGVLYYVMNRDRTDSARREQSDEGRSVIERA